MATPSWPPEETAFALEMWELGVSYSVIGQMLDRRRQAVRGYIERRDPTNPRSLKDAERRARMAAELRGEVWGAPSGCELHLSLIAKANGGRGFAFYNLPPAYRIAA